MKTFASVPAKILSPVVTLISNPNQKETYFLLYNTVLTVKQSTFTTHHWSDFRHKKLRCKCQNTEEFDKSDNFEL